MKALPKHQNICGFEGGGIFADSLGLILLEFCPNGTVFDLMEKNQDKKLSEAMIVNVLR